MDNNPKITEWSTFFRLVEAKYQTLIDSGNEPGHWHEFYADETVKFLLEFQK